MTKQAKVTTTATDKSGKTPTMPSDGPHAGRTRSAVRPARFRPTVTR
jgi:hypothetical protein